MQELNDNSLLFDYVEHDSEDALATLVARHVNKVYSIALRHTRNPDQAEEITQAVFVILARKSRQLGNRVILSGWLCQTARLTAVTFIRSEARRARREQEAHMQNSLNESESDVWPQIAPLLDAAMARLSEADHHAVVLRFFDGKSMKEVGAAFGASEDAAKMRVNRAVEKLRLFFTRRGIVIPAAALTAAISTNSIQAAPALLAKTATTVALAKGATASTSTLTLIKGALKIMAWTKAKTAIVIGVGALLVAGTAIVGVKEIAAQTATVAVKEIATQGDNAWQKRWDPSVLDRLPPQVKILPSLPSTVQSHIELSTAGPRGVFALGQSVLDLLRRAYGVPWDQLILDAPLPEGKYDVIANLPPTGKTDPDGLSEDNRKAMQEEIQKKFGLTGERKTIETNVLILTVQSRHAPGLRRPAGGTHHHSGPGYYSAHGLAIPALLRYLNQYLGVIIINQTGLEGAFDIDFKWDKTPEGLKRTLRDQVGLELIPTNMPVEIVVVKKSK